MRGEFPEVKNSSDLKRAIYSQLKEMIMRRDFSPNERIDAADIAEQLGVSRTPVRDALNLLGSDGLVKTIPRQGVYVKGIYKEDLIEIFQYREMIELFSIEAGINNIPSLWNTAEEVMSFFEQQLSTEQDQFNHLQVIDADIMLHKLIVQSTRNQRIIEAYSNLNYHVQMARSYYLQDVRRMMDAHLEHKMIFDALLAGDHERAKQMMKKHLGTTLRNLLKIIDIHKVF